MDEDEEYRDGEYDYCAIESQIEDIVDEYGLRAYVYIESDAYDNILTSTMVREDEDDEHCEAVQLEALSNLVIDLLNEHEDDERNALIAEIYDRVYQAIHAYHDSDDEEETEW